VAYEVTRRREHGDGLRVGLVEELVLPAADLDQAVQVGGVDDVAPGAHRAEAGLPDERRDEGEQLQRAERLAQERLRPGGPRGAPRFVRAADRDDRDLARLRRLAQPLEIEDAVDTGEPDVEQDRIRARLGKGPLGLDHVVGRIHLVSLELERRADELTQQPVVVDDQ